MNSTCISCDASPVTSEDGVIAFSVSLTGDFNDVTSSLPYRYYLPTAVHSTSDAWAQARSDWPPHW